MGCGTFGTGGCRGSVQEFQGCCFCYFDHGYTAQNRGRSMCYALIQRCRAVNSLIGFILLDFVILWFLLDHVLLLEDVYTGALFLLLLFSLKATTQVGLIFPLPTTLLSTLSTDGLATLLCFTTSRRLPAVDINWVIIEDQQ